MGWILISLNSITIFEAWDGLPVSNPSLFCHPPSVISAGRQRWSIHPLPYLRVCGRYPSPLRASPQVVGGDPSETDQDRFPIENVGNHECGKTPDWSWGSGLRSDKSLASLLNAFSKGMQECLDRCRLSFSEALSCLIWREQCPGDCWYCDDEGCGVLLDGLTCSCEIFSLPTFLQNFVAPKRLFIIWAIFFILIKIGIIFWK